MLCRVVLCCAVYRSDPPAEDAPQPAMTREQILSACDGSLRRLQTDYIDLYQIHCEWTSIQAGLAAGLSVGIYVVYLQPLW
jgi:aryl-alcohol dehydrogenase-like predicted oxidoreductase